MANSEPRRRINHDTVVCERKPRGIYDTSIQDIQEICSSESNSSAVTRPESQVVTNPLSIPGNRVNKRVKITTKTSERGNWIMGAVALPTMILFIKYLEKIIPPSAVTGVCFKPDFWPWMLFPKRILQLKSVDYEEATEAKLI